MKVLDLHCSHQHSFEGWFGSEDDFQSQLSRRLVQCPLCGNADITKKLSAPRFNLGKAVVPTSASEVITDSNIEGKTGSSSTSSALNKQNQEPHQSHQSQQSQRPNLSAEAAVFMQAAWLEAAKFVMANTEDVGSSFASEARKIHYGEADERAIRGQATPDQTMELIEEGIEVASMPIPESIKHPLN